MRDDRLRRRSDCLAVAWHAAKRRGVPLPVNPLARELITLCEPMVRYRGTAANRPAPISL